MSTFVVNHTPYLQLGNAPLTGFAGSETDRAQIIWQTMPGTASGNDSFVVEYRAAGAATWINAGSISTIETGVSNRVNRFADITGLNFNADYEYRVRHMRDSTVVHDYQTTFHTRLPAGSTQPFTFVAYGDSASGNPPTGFLSVQNRINAITSAFSVMMGDNVYSSGTHPQFDLRFDPAINAPTPEYNKNHVEYYSLGNHDVATAGGQPSRDNYAVPIPVAGVTSNVNGPAGAPAENNYSFDYGNAHFTIYDSNDGISTAEADWMVADMQASTAKWKFVVYHHPMSTTDTLAEQLRAAGVDVFLGGHVHSYSRSQSDSQFSEGNQIIEVIAGTGGASSNTENWGYLKIDATANGLTVSYVRADSGNTVDTFTIIGQNSGSGSAPTNVTLSANTVAENSANNTVVGTLTSTDPNVGDTHTYTLTNNAGGRFGISGNQLVVANGSLLNFETNTSHTVTVLSTDSTGLIFSKSFTINVANVNEVPTANSNSYAMNWGGTLNANDANGSVNGTNDDSVRVNDTDPENGALSAVLVAAPTHASGFTLNTNGTFTYTHNSDTANSDSFTYRVSDGPNQSNIATVTIIINSGLITTTFVSLQEGVNGYAGTIDTTINAASKTSTSGSSATTVEAKDNPSKGSLLRWELPSITTGSIVQSAAITMRVTNTSIGTFGLYELLRSWTEAGATWNQYAVGAGWGTPGAQQIGVDRAAAVLASFTSPNKGFLTINLNSDGIALVQKWIDTPSTNHGVTIQNYVTTTSDTVGFDSSEATTIANRPKLSFTYSNPPTPPTITTTASARSYAENNPATAIDPGLTTSDPDSFYYAGATVAITGAFASGQDVLGFANQNGISGAYNAATGVLTLSGAATPANYQTALRSVTYVNTSETPNSANRTVTFSVNDGAMTVSATRTITVTPVNDAPTAISFFGHGDSVPEQSFQGEVGDFSTTDPDEGNSHTYTLTDDAGGRFSISDGELFVANGSLLDFETNTSHSITVLTTDSGGLSFSKSFTINVGDVNEVPTALMLVGDSVPENAPLGTDVGNLSTTDPDAGDFHTYSLVDDAGGRFAISGDHLVVANGPPAGGLDFETTTSHSVTVLSTDSVGLSVSMNFTIYVTDVNEFDPVLNDATFSLAENSANSTAVGSVTGTDADATDGGLSYSITGGNALGIFAINSVTGEITVSDNTNLDRELISSVVLTITVSDNGPGSARTDPAQVTINLDDVNEFTPVVTAAQSFSLAENSANTTVVGSVLATDGDATASFSDWTITGGTGATAFAINASTGQITVLDSAQLDRELTSSLTLLVTVSDGTNTSAVESVTINIDDVNEFDPVLNDATFSLAENLVNSTSVGTMTATDADATNGGLSYAITGGNALEIFAINSVTGELTVANNTNLDREAIASLVLTITVSDNGAGSARTDTAQVTINVDDVNDVTPVVTAGQSATIDENLSNDSSVLTVAATDGDVTATTFQTWTITGGSGSTAFAINANTGVVTVLDSAQLNREATSDFTLFVTVSDGVQTSESQNVTISLDDVNEFTPAVTVPQSFMLAENSANATVVGTVVATDGDATASLSGWTITGGTGATAFAINASTGQITVLDSLQLDRELTSNFTLLVTVSDETNTSAIESVTINIDDVNELDPVLDDATFSLVENVVNTTSVGSVAGTDADATNGGLSYAITGGNALSIFAINSVTGEITVSNHSNLDRETVSSVVLTITVSDNGPGSPRTDTAQVTINVDDVNDVTPVVTAGQSATIDENLPNDSSVLTVVASDNDVTATTFQTWTITGGSGETAFAINAGTGVVTVLDRAQLNREATSGFTLLVTVSDGVQTSESQTVTISLDDVNEFAPAVTVSQSFMLAENSANTTVVGTVLATDGDATASLSGWTITGGTGATAFTINASTGQITVLDSLQLDRELTASFTLLLTVSDGTNPSAVESVTINIDDVNEFDPVLYDATFSLAENLVNSTSVGTMTATDADATNGGLNYAITSGNALEIFAINSVTGELTVANNTNLDREAIASLVLTITVSDNGAGSARTDTAQVTINVDDVSDVAPVVTAGQNATIDENLSKDSSVLTVMATDGDVTATTYQNWTITGGSGETAFAINAATGEITVLDSTSLNRETTASFTLLVAVSDGAHTSIEETVTINLHDVNEFTPAVTVSQSFMLAENSANTTVVGTVLATDGDATASLSGWTITGGTGATAFAINASTGQITVVDSAQLDFELTSSFTLLLTVSDGTNTSVDESVTITLSDVVNEFDPKLSDATFSLVENVVNTTSVGSVAGTDADATNGGLSYAITGGNALSIFAINSVTGEITVSNHSNLDRETVSSVVLTITVSDNGPGSPRTDTAQVTINVDDVNDVTPVVTAGQSATIDENLPNDSSVLTVMASDGDVTVTTFQNWTITGGSGSTAFAINASTGVVTVLDSAQLNREATSGFTLLVTVSDGVQTSAAQTVTISLDDVNELPTANSNAYSVNRGATLNANDATGTVGGTSDNSVLVNDTDPETNFLSLTAVKVTDPMHGTLTLNANGTFTYTHNNDTATSDSFTYRASDGTNQSNIATVTFTINPGGGTSTTVSLQDGVNGYAGTIDTTIKADYPTSATSSSAVTVEAKDNPDRALLLRWELPSSLTGNIVQSASITVWVTNSSKTTYQLYELLRSWTEGGATWNQYTAGAGWGTAGAQRIDVDRAAAVLASLTLPNTGFATINLNADGIAMVQKWINTPSTNHGVTIQNYVTTSGDGVGFDSSEAPTAANRPKLTITYLADGPINNPPTITTTASALSYTENNPATSINPGLTTSDVDSVNYVGATVSITGGFASGQDVLGFANQNGISGAYNASTGVLTLSGTSSVANYQAALRSVTYVNTSENPSGSNRTVTFTVNDGALTASTTRTISVTPVNDAPTANGNAYSVNRGATLNASDATGTVAGTNDDSVLVNDTDLENTALSAVLVAGPTHASGFTLNPNGTFTYTHNNDSATSDSFTYRASDGTNQSNLATVTITINPVAGQPPTITTTASALSYTENNPATAFDPGLTTSDLDSTNYVGATVSITGGFASGQDVLGFANQNGISGAYNASTGVLTLSGTSSMANYQTALRSVTYVNTSENPSGSNRTAMVTVNDGALTASATRTISVTPVNDAPTANSDAYTVNRGATLNASDATGTVAGTNDDSVLVNDTDLENTALSAVLVAGPTHASAFTLNANGTFTYTHNNDSATSDSFTYRVSDGTNQSNIATVTFTINPGGSTSTTVSLQEGVNGYVGTIDTTIKADFPTSTSGASATTVESKDNPDRGSLLRWELPSSLSGNIVQSASITLWVTNNTTSTYQLYELLRSWTEAGATWSQYAAGAAWGTAGAQRIDVDRAAAVLATLTLPNTGFATINLNSAGIAMVQKWINTPSTNHGVTIQNYVTTSGDGVGFDSSEAPAVANRPKLTITYGSGIPLMAASTVSMTSSSPTGSDLTEAALVRIGQEATARWLTIAPTGMHDAIRTAAGSITFAIADLPGQTLGTSFEQTILIDRDAAGFGWFIDRTPRDDREFDEDHDALPTSLADGHMDLLSVVAHEIGHTLGYDHDGTLEVMRESLEAGHRTISIDRDAAGFGWSIDRTARDVREFGASHDATLTSPADGHMDLLSVVAHEIGQTVAYDYDSTLDTMRESLEAGLRTMTGKGDSMDAVDAFFQSVGSHHGGSAFGGLNPFM